MPTVPMYDPRSPQVRTDPYPVYRAMRAHEPVTHVPTAGTWFVTSHEHCLAVLCDPRFSAHQGQQLRQRSTALPTSMLTADGPEHVRLRGAAAPAFGPEAMVRTRSWLAPLVGGAVRRLCGVLGSGSDVDLVDSFAQPLAEAVLGRFLGLTEAELPEFAAWGRAVSVNLDPFADPEAGGHAAGQMLEMLERFAEHLQARSAQPADDALSVLAGSHAAGVLSPGEALSAAGLLVVGGLDPLANLVANAAAAMLEQPQPKASARPGSRTRTVCEEFLRYDAPIQFTARSATRDVELGGRRISAGENVVILLGASNRDPARFADPDRLDPDRRTNPHLSFGAGAHVCLGAPLVRLFANLIVEALPQQMPALTAGRTPAVRGAAVVPRGYEHLPVRLSSAVP